jgi:uncharacterized membrane protein
MKRRIAITILAALLCASAASAADQGTTAPSWIMNNSGTIFGALLAISELMALIPAFKGNGILDSIIKALKALAGNND